MVLPLLLTEQWHTCDHNYGQGNLVGGVFSMQKKCPAENERGVNARHKNAYWQVLTFKTARIHATKAVHWWRTNYAIDTSYSTTKYEAKTV